MGLNKQKGNMYPWVTHTWNVIKGKCPHDCSYCYMKLYPQKAIRFDASELKTDLGEGNFIFVGNSCDAWARALPDEWIDMMLEHCRLYLNNRYLFQSKNPEQFYKWEVDLPPKTMLGTTIETNRRYNFSKAPEPYMRAYHIAHLAKDTMISIEPIMDFDVEVMMRWISDIKPEFVSIGADSKGHKLPEPSPEKVQYLIEELQGITTVKLKDNLKRFLKV